ncbi:MAG: YciI family protein [Bacteroidota bacterium]
MKKLVFFCVFFLVSVQLINVQAQPEKEKKPAPKIEQYWFILLKTGPKTDFDSSTRARLFQGHMANMNKLYYDGILKVAGPFGKNDLSWRGLFVFDVKTKEEAEKIATTDPAIAAGLFAVDIIPWYSEPTGSLAHGKPKKEE